MNIGPLIQWVNGNTRPTDLVVADNEPLVYLFTGRQAVPGAPFTAEQYIRVPTDSEKVQAFYNVLHEYPALYYVTVTPGARDLARSIARVDSSGLRELGEIPNGAAFQMH